MVATQENGKIIEAQKAECLTQSKKNMIVALITFFKERVSRPSARE